MNSQRHPTSRQEAKCFILCQNFTAMFVPINILRLDERTGDIYILAGEDLEVIVFRDGDGDLSMQPDFSIMSPRELRAYLLQHRNDTDAIHARMQQILNDPNAISYSAEEISRFDEIYEEHRKRRLQND